MSDHSGSVTAVAPVKALRAAKSRLDVDPDLRARLALAFAADAVDALAAVPDVREVLVVTDDATVVTELRRTAVIVPEHGTGLGAAVTRGLTEAGRRHPGDVLLVTPTDLPCLRPVDVLAVLRQYRDGGRVADRGAFVPDTSGEGTTLVVLPPGASPATAHGPGSARRHVALGLRRLERAPVRARHDVDTLRALGEARRLGAGPRTHAVLTSPGVATDLHVDGGLC